MHQKSETRIGLIRIAFAEFQRREICSDVMLIRIGIRHAPEARRRPNASCRHRDIAPTRALLLIA